jgi:hypothetical protein
MPSWQVSRTPDEKVEAMIGDSASVLIARIRFADLQPTMCWIAPLIPQAM